MTKRNVTRDRQVFIFFALTERSRAHYLLDEGLYPDAIRAGLLLARAEDPSTPTYWAASTVERRELGPAVPGLMQVLCEGYDDATPSMRTRYRDEARTQLAAGYCLTREHDGSRWVDLQDPWAWLATLGLVRYESPFEPDEVDTIEEAARAADVPLADEDKAAIRAALNVAIPLAFARAGQTPAGLRAELKVGAASARFMAGD